MAMGLNALRASTLPPTSSRDLGPPRPYPLLLRPLLFLRRRNAPLSAAKTTLPSPEKTKIKNRFSYLSNGVEEEEEEEEYGEEEEEEEEEEEGGESSSSSSFLSLSEKPNRSIALLDDYEIEELDSSECSNHRSGYVAVLGKPNVGKSTLSNQMIGQKLSIVTEKPQTTRHRILGICSGPEYQMILYDTPGVIEKKMHKLDLMMMNNVRSASINADCVLVVVDACKVPQKIDDVLEEGIGALKQKLPVLLVLNKKDLIKPGEIAKRLEGIVSEHPERFFVAEIVREKIFMQYRNEVPYACQVNVRNYIARPTSKDFIQVEIVVEKDSQKMILIGKEGRALKVLATAARLDVEDFLQKKVFLEVEVKVKENWRQDEGLLKHYGYSGQIRVF